MSKNKLTTYLLYAIGEVILVVVGILIAVQIDTWNKGRETSNITKNYLVNLKTEMESNKVRLSETIGVTGEILTSTRRLANIMGHDSISYTNSEIADLLNAFAPNVKLDFNTAVLDELISSGNIKNIQNQELRLSLSNLLPQLEKIRFGDEILQEDREKCIDVMRQIGSFRSVSDQSGVSTEWLRILPGNDNDMNQKVLKSKVFENNLLLFMLNLTGRERSYQRLSEDLDILIKLIDDTIQS